MWDRVAQLSRRDSRAGIATITVELCGRPGVPVRFQTHNSGDSPVLRFDANGRQRIVRKPERFGELSRDPGAWCARYFIAASEGTL